MKASDGLPPNAISPLHGVHDGERERFLDALQEQEEAQRAAGFDVEGITDFFREWGEGWSGGDTKLLERCMDPAIVYTDSSSLGKEVSGLETTVKACGVVYQALPDGVIYPWDRSVRSLPYWDVMNGVVRLTVPWRAIGRWSGPVKMQSWLPAFPPNFHDVDTCGTDRYEIVRRDGRWRMARIDTDWDVLTLLGQASPLRLPSMGGRGGRTLVRLAGVLSVATWLALRNRGPSLDHDRFRRNLSKFHDGVRDQEKRLTGAGIVLASGMSDFIAGWLSAFAKRDVDALSNMISPKVVFTDGSAGEREHYGRDVKLAQLRAIFHAFPDLAIYPQDQQMRSLPYWDFSGGYRRVAIPWRAVGRFTRPLRLPGRAAVMPTGQSISLVGVDRYLLSDDWRVDWIDSTWDRAGFIAQATPLSPLVRWLTRPQGK